MEMPIRLLFSISLFFKKLAHCCFWQLSPPPFELELASDRSIDWRRRLIETVALWRYYLTIGCSPVASGLYSGGGGCNFGALHYFFQLQLVQVSAPAR